MQFMISGNDSKRYLHWRFFWLNTWSKGFRIP